MKRFYVSITSTDTRASDGIAIARQAHISAFSRGREGVLTIKDVADCYPKMPHEAIRMAMREHIARIKRESGQCGVSVPRFGDSKKCEWRKRPESDRRLIWNPFSVMLDVMDFALNHAIVQTPDGSLRRQVRGYR